MAGSTYSWWKDLGAGTDLILDGALALIRGVASTSCGRSDGILCRDRINELGN